MVHHDDALLISIPIKIMIIWTVRLRLRGDFGYQCDAGLFESKFVEEACSGNTRGGKIGNSVYII